MKLNGKQTLCIMMGLSTTVLGCTDFGVLLHPRAVSLVEHDNPSTCVSERVSGSLLLRDFDRQISLTACSEISLEYWIDGERETPGCHWHLRHIECQENGCLYRCQETESLWQLSFLQNARLKMEKCGYSTLPQTYLFSLTPTGQD